MQDAVVQPVGGAGFGEPFLPDLKKVEHAERMQEGIPLWISVPE